MKAQDFGDVQGNVLRPYGHSFTHVAHLFGTVDELRTEAWRLLLSALTDDVTRGQWDEKPASTLNVGFSFRALRCLRPQLAAEMALHFEAFAQGMPARSHVLGDDAEFRTRRWEERHVWLSIHAQSQVALNAAVVALKARAGALDLTEETHGNALLQDGNRYEHFGFRDDISNPVVEGTPGVAPEDLPGNGTRQDGVWRALEAGEFVLGYPTESGRLPLASLSPEARDVLRNGTFGVVRHLQQHVATFRRYVRANAHGSVEALAACLMGRKLDGEPLSAVTPGAVGGAALRDFTYETDPAGSRCPLGAHTRRANQREDGRHRLMRRGMTYGAALPPDREQEADGDARGLWFVAFNADIEDQFEFVQQRWLNGPFGTLSQARDPIVGSGGPRGMAIEGDTTLSRAPRVLLELPRFVTCRGGQYYFCPGHRGLKALCSAPLQSGLGPKEVA